MLGQAFPRAIRRTASGAGRRRVRQFHRSGNSTPFQADDFITGHSQPLGQHLGIDTAENIAKGLLIAAGERFDIAGVGGQADHLVEGGDGCRAGRTVQGAHLAEDISPALEDSERLAVSFDAHLAVHDKVDQGVIAALLHNRLAFLIFLNLADPHETCQFLFAERLQVGYPFQALNQPLVILQVARFDHGSAS